MSSSYAIKISTIDPGSLEIINMSSNPPEAIDDIEMGESRVPQLQPAIEFHLPTRRSLKAEFDSGFVSDYSSDSESGRQHRVRKPASRYTIFDSPVPIQTSYDGRRSSHLSNFGGDGADDCLRSGAYTDLTDPIDLPGEQSDEAGEICEEFVVKRKQRDFRLQRLDINNAAGNPPGSLTEHAKQSEGNEAGKDRTRSKSRRREKSKNGFNGKSHVKGGGITTKEYVPATPLLPFMDESGGNKSRGFPANSPLSPITSKFLRTDAGPSSMYDGRDVNRTLGDEGKEREGQVLAIIDYPPASGGQSSSTPAQYAGVGILHAKDNNAIINQFHKTADTAAVISTASTASTAQPTSKVDQFDALSRLLTRQSMFLPVKSGHTINLAPAAAAATQKSLRRAAERHGKDFTDGDKLGDRYGKLQTKCFAENFPLISETTSAVTSTRSGAYLGHKRGRHTVLSAKAVAFVPASVISAEGPDSIPTGPKPAPLSPTEPASAQPAFLGQCIFASRRLPFPQEPPRPSFQVSKNQVATLANNNSGGVYSYTKTWTSSATAGQEVWSRISKQLSFMHCDESFVTPRTYAAYLEHKKNFMIASIAEKEAQITKRKAEKALAIKNRCPEGLPIITIPCMGGKKFADGRSAALGQASMWTPNEWRTESARKQQAEWPSVAELKWEGDERAKSGKGRFLPIPRRASWDDKLIRGAPVSGQGKGDRMWEGAGAVPWPQRRKVKLAAMDRVWGEDVLDEEWLFDRVEETAQDMEVNIVGRELMDMING